MPISMRDKEIDYTNILYEIRDRVNGVTSELVGIRNNGLPTTKFLRDTQRQYRSSGWISVPTDSTTVIDEFQGDFGMCIESTKIFVRNKDVKIGVAVTQGGGGWVPLSEIMTWDGLDFFTPRYLYEGTLDHRYGDFVLTQYDTNNEMYIVEMKPYGNITGYKIELYNPFGPDTIGASIVIFSYV